ncbi:MAG TPA: sulfite exporter TauE/SafE family protein [Gaiellaceae bacterium]|nr:sulfite exporter TauE/SafE family protein [Gaiellaceae bacterium]
MTYALAVVLGLVAGILSGLFGVGGGVLFVPTLTALGLSQLHAEASSLLAIIPTVIVGVWRQQRYGNVRWRSATTIGVASIAATVAGAQVAETLPEATLRKLFAVLLLVTAGQIAWRARKG